LSKPAGVDAAEPAPLDENEESLTALMAEIENLSPEEFDRLEKEMYLAPEKASEKAPAVEPHAENVEASPPGAEKASFENPSQKVEIEREPTIFQSNYTAPTTAQTIRNSGLAWSAGVVLFGSVVFMMIFGWFADLLFGSSPYGIIGGIILGGIIGFIQLFRITSQIYKK
jgi:F0F1-type ATP synthase assembly protein I